MRSKSCTLVNHLGFIVATFPMVAEKYQATRIIAFEGRLFELKHAAGGEPHPFHEIAADITIYRSDIDTGGKNVA